MGLCSHGARCQLRGLQLPAVPLRRAPLVRHGGHRPAARRRRRGQAPGAAGAVDALRGDAVHQAGDAFEGKGMGNLVHNNPSMSHIYIHIYSGEELDDDIVFVSLSFFDIYIYVRFLF